MIIDTYTDSEPRANLVGLGSSELRLIVAALDEYKKNLLKTLASVHEDLAKAKPVVSDGLEDEAFCYSELAKIAQMLFDIQYNHGSSTTQSDIKEMLR